MRNKTATYILLLLSLLSLRADGQSNAGSLTATQLTEGNVYAVVVGISEYQHPHRKLHFADADAKAFHDYLISPAGGSVPRENIKTLINEDATVANIYVALKWLKDTVKRDDLVYFYFAGHGDIESELYKLGFLLAYDTPVQNYVNLAVRIEDLNILANEMSVLREANVILITDACHSGQLAGSDNARMQRMLSDQLAKAKGREIRLASCEHDEKSQESEAWGGGRGVFSYYLIHGLMGYADREVNGIKDGQITKDEIRRYLEDRVPDDVFEIKELSQHPVVDGERDLMIAIVNDSIFNKLPEPKASRTTVNVEGRSVGFIRLPIDQFFADLAYTEFIEETDFDTWTPSNIDSLVMDLFAKKSHLVRDTLLRRIWSESLRTDPEFRKRFHEKLSAVLHDYIQQAINRYLASDHNELAKRQYYAQEGRYYARYPAIAQAGMDLIESDHPLYRLLEIKYHYFKGINYRLELPFSSKKPALRAQAILEQTKAYLLDSTAAYILNEMAILFKSRGDNDRAEEYYLKATQSAPTWAIPWSNLSGLYASNGLLKAGLECGKKAISLNPDYAFAYINLGLNYARENNSLLAEEYYWKGLRRINQHYIPYELLGHVHVHMTEYDKAEAFYREAHGAKLGLAAMPGTVNVEGEPPTAGIIRVDDDKACTNSILIENVQVLKHMSLGIFAFDQGRDSLAAYYFNTVVSEDPKNPLVWRYLGEIHLKNGYFTEAEYCLELAMQCHLSKARFESYIDSIGPGIPDDDCSKLAVNGSWFPRIDLQFIQAKMYEDWAHFNKANALYEALVTKNPSLEAAHYKKWSLLHRLGMVEEAVAALENYSKTSFEASGAFANYLMNLADRYPNSLHYQDRAGRFLLKYMPLAGTMDPFFIKPQWSYPVEDDKNSDMILVVSMPQSIPGTGEMFRFNTEITNPLHQSIKYLNRAADLSLDSIKISRYYTMVADIYVALNSTWHAIPFEEKAVQFMPNDFSLRKRLIHHLDEWQEFEKALLHFDYLYERGGLSAGDFKMYIKYLVLHKEFQKADVLHGYVLYNFPNEVEKYDSYTAWRSLLSQDFARAQLGYTELLEDESESANYYYTLCRINSINGYNDLAYQYLNMALSQGFEYFYVLKFDSYLEGMKRDVLWKEYEHLMPEIQD